MLLIVTNPQGIITNSAVPFSSTALKEEWILGLQSSGDQKHESKWTLMLLCVCWMNQ